MTSAHYALRIRAGIGEDLRPCATSDQVWRKTAHVYGTITLEDADFTFRFADVFNGQTFFVYLNQLVAKYSQRKLFLIIDNGPGHNLCNQGK